MVLGGIIHVVLLLTVANSLQPRAAAWCEWQGANALIGAAGAPNALQRAAHVWSR